MSDDDFPTEYDAIVLGTGMAECIVAAALSRIGQKVLHLDRNDYYSGDWACFHLEAMQRWISKHQDGLDVDKLQLKETADPKTLIQDEEKLIDLNVESNSISNVMEHTFIRAESNQIPEASPSTDTDSPEKEFKPTTNSHEEEMKSAADGEENKDVMEEGCQESTEVKKTPPEEKEDTPKEKETEKKKEWTMDELKRQWRKFNLDLIPKVLYCRGAMVELLISSDIAKYCEFKTISRVLTYINGKLEQVPCSRSDVFSSKQVSMIEKRMMMKFLTFAMDYEKQPEQYEGKENMLFTEYLKSQRLTANVQHYIRQAIAMATDTTTTLEGLVSTQKFLRSLGRYGNTAFLWPVYGAGELPQCFCRMCAVFGGIYCLRRTAKAIIVDKGSCVGIVDTEGKRLKSKYLIMDTSYAGQALLEETGQDRTISRAILVTDRSIQGESEDNITLLSIPIEDGRNVTVYELGSCSYACPEGLYIVHLTCQGSTNGPQADFAGVLGKLFQPTASEGASSEQDDQPSVLWAVYFSVQDSSDVKLQATSPDNVYLVAGPDVALDFDQSITQAREIFEKICPGEEFLPKAPNPEDIIWGDGEGNTPADSGFQAEGGGETEREGGTGDGMEGVVKEEGTADDSTENECKENGDSEKTAEGVDVEKTIECKPEKDTAVSDSEVKQRTEDSKEKQTDSAAEDAS